jgi:two-component system, OmpR family, sensor kinase
MKDAGDAGSGLDEAAKDRLIEQLRDAVRARDEFVAIAAHELRNPMTPIVMQVHALLRLAGNPENCRPEYLAPRLEQLEVAIRDFLRRSNMLLDMSRIGSASLEIRRMEIDLSQVARSVVERWAVAARMGGCELTSRLEGDVIAIVDEAALDQVIENLLSNAIKFGAGSPVQISLRSDGHVARLVVQDDGDGISDKDQARIFERFERAVTKREHGGFGIGLWVANQLVRAMGGDLALKSAPGAGSAFTVTLPVNAGELQGAGE